jgi:amino acid adenylation domain-containing protein
MNMNTLLQQSLTRQAERRPEAWALVMVEDRISYAQLEQSTNQLARQLKAVGCQKGDRVCLMMPKSSAAISSILGILKADCVYVPLDSSWPTSRVAKIIATCEPRCILVSGRVASLLSELDFTALWGNSIAVGWMGAGESLDKGVKAQFSGADLDSYPDEPLDYRNTGDDAAYIMFTSGSTGDPKGVVITHTNVIHFVDWAIEYFGIDVSDRNSGHPPLHFDLSAFDIFGTIAAGAQLHLVPPDLNVLPNKLAAFIRAEALTQWFSVPSVLNYMAKFEVVKFNDFPTLKRILWCGEVLPTPMLIYWMKRLPHVRFTNLYGPTETTIASSYYTVPDCPESERVPTPIGTACKGEDLSVRDSNLERVCPGEVGDLYIGGVGLSPGYWRDPEKTSAMFLPDPLATNPSERIYRTGDLAKIDETGLLYFLGRTDSQIKSRGYRIELGEIEAALSTLTCLQESAVVAVSVNGFERVAICCAFVPLSHGGISNTALRKNLGMLLPAYMLPSRWIAMSHLPKNAAGKIDRCQLREIFQNNEASTS